MDNQKYTVSSTPHILSGDSIEKIMRDVLIALAPAALAGVYFFGMRALMLIILSIAACVFFEGMYQKITKQPVTVTDLSAAVTGLLLAMNLPAAAPFWIPIVGAFFAIIIAKQLFGGLGQNFINPALAGRAFLLASYPAEMTAWTEPVRNFFNLGTDAVSSATPLSLMQNGVDSISSATPVVDVTDLILGNTAGCLGETCAIALILGGCYLLYKKVISWHIPAVYILTVFVLSYVLGRDGFMTGDPVFEIFAGGLMLGAIFMATDYSSSPTTPTGQLIMGFGCGLMTVIIRVYGGYAEGVSYSILLMNLAAPLIERYTKPRVFGKKGATKNA